MIIKYAVITFVFLFFLVGILVTIKDIKNIIFIIVPSLMFIFWYSLINGGFGVEKNKSKKLLKSILQATEIE
jgi:hypothetical protein